MPGPSGGPGVPGRSRRDSSLCRSLAVWPCSSVVSEVGTATVPPSQDSGEDVSEFKSTGETDDTLKFVENLTKGLFTDVGAGCRASSKERAVLWASTAGSPRKQLGNDWNLERERKRGRERGRGRERSVLGGAVLFDESPLSLHEYLALPL